MAARIIKFLRYRVYFQKNSEEIAKNRNLEFKIEHLPMSEQLYIGEPFGLS